MFEVILSGPNDLDRTVDLLGDFDSARDAVAFQPTERDLPRNDSAMTVAA